LGCPVITIHDSIGIDILSVDKFENIGIVVMQHVFDLDPFSLNKQSEVYLKVGGNMIFL
jgi:hypothetical protein